jgi:hypothetical protein
MATGLNGRVAQLEAAMLPQTDHCRTCGLRHVQPLTLDLARRIIGVTDWASLDLRRHVAQHPPPKLCLCDPCCSDPKDRVLARMSHGLESEG